MNNLKAITKLKREAVNVRHALSTLRHISIVIENFNDVDDFVETLTLARFEDLNKDLFRKMVKSMQNFLKVFNVSKSMIEDIVLIGGSLHIPMIQQKARDFLDSKEPLKNINFEEGAPLCDRQIELYV